MTNFLKFAAKRGALVMAALLAAVVIWSPAAHAGVAIENTVVLDPFDPTPPIQFQHWYSGYGCDYGCNRRCYDNCSRPRCYDNCRPRCRDNCERVRCRDNCNRDCDRDRCDRGYNRTRCDRDCDDDRDRAYQSFCTGPRCYDVERWEHRWRDGDRIGQEWYDRGRREKEWSRDRGTDDKFYGNDKQDPNWRDYDEDDNGPPADKH